MPTLSSLVAVLLAASSLLAQAPDGHYVVSSFSSSSTGLGGLFLLHPRSVGPAVVVTGLGPDLTGGNAFGFEGANCVSIRPDDGALLVGELVNGVGSVDLHEIVLGGSAVALDVPTSVGMTQSGGGIHQIAMLPNGDAVFCATGLLNQPPLNGSELGFFDRATRMVTPIVVPALAGRFLNAVAIDHTGMLLYVAVQVGQTAGIEVYSVSTGGGAVNLIATILGGASLAVESSGRLIATNITNIVEIDPATGLVTTRATVGSNTPQGIAASNGMLMGTL